MDQHGSKDNLSTKHKLKPKNVNKIDDLVNLSANNLIRIRPEDMDIIPGK